MVLEVSSHSGVWTKERGRWSVVPAKKHPALCKPGADAVEYYGDGSRTVTVVSPSFYSPALEQRAREEEGDAFDPDECYNCVMVKFEGVEEEVPLTRLGIFVKN